MRWRNGATGETEDRPVRHVFCMMGADPCTSWLEGCVALDDKGFVKTGQDLTPEDLASTGWPLSRPPLLLETSRPGIFAVGDVRSGNIKRVASAVGEGSISIQLVHRVLAAAERRSVARPARAPLALGPPPRPDSRSGRRASRARPLPPRRRRAPGIGTAAAQDAFEIQVYDADTAGPSSPAWRSTSTTSSGDDQPGLGARSRPTT